MPPAHLITDQSSGGPTSIRPREAIARLGYTDEEILLREAAAELGVSYVRVRQIVAQARKAIDRHERDRAPLTW